MFISQFIQELLFFFIALTLRKGLLHPYSL